MGQHSKLCRFLAPLICSIALLPDAHAVVSEVHASQIDYADWLENRGYNPERDQIVDIHNWNRLELQGSWPATEYSYYEWLEVSDYYETEEDDE
jgi:hypothetical protein